jgi:MFS transporter, putative metabolite:H+ symporter
MANAYPSTSLDGPSLIGRLERLPFSRWHIRPRVIVGSATFFDAFDALSLAFVLPVLVKLWGLSPTEIGTLIAVGYVGQFVGALAFGALAESIGRIRSMAAAVAIMSVMSLACALSPGYTVLLICRFIQGIGVGGEMPVAAVYINELSKAKGRGRFFLLYEMIFPVGLMVTGQVGAIVVPMFGWQLMFLLGGIPGLIITFLILRLPESPRWLISKNRLAEAEAIVREIEASSPTTVPAGAVAEQPATSAPPAPAPPPPAVGSRSRWTELLGASYRRRTVVVWLIWICAYFITNGLNNWMPTLYNRVYGLDLQSALRAGTLTNVVQVVVLLGCAFLIDRTGRRRWTVACFVLGALLLAVLGLWAADSVVAVITLVTIAYGIIGSANAVLYLYTPEIYPTRMRAIGTGAATCWLRLASATAPILVGYLVAAEGVRSVFLMFAAVGVVGAIVASRMLETQNKRLEDIAA